MNQTEVKKNITCFDVAEYFIALSNETGESITNLKLQKLVYYAQAWYLANNKKKLYEEEIQAWIHGPVIPELYDKYKKFGSTPIIEDIKIDNIKDKFDRETFDYLEELAKVYMTFGGYELEAMSHKEDPWIEARQGIGADISSSNVISTDLMKKFYGEKITV